MPGPCSISWGEPLNLPWLFAWTIFASFQVHFSRVNCLDVPAHISFERRPSRKDILFLKIHSLHLVEHILSSIGLCHESAYRPLKTTFTDVQFCGGEFVPRRKAAVREHASVTHLDIGIEILVYLLIIHQTQQRLLKQTFLPRTCTAEQGACQRWPTAEHSRWELGMAWLLSDKRSLTFSCHACNHNKPCADVMPGDNNPFAVRAGRPGERLFLVCVVLSRSDVVELFCVELTTLKW